MADLVADIVALDVDGLDVFAAQAVLALALGEHALGLGLLVAHAARVEDLVLGKEHERADERMHEADQHEAREADAVPDEGLDHDVEADDHEYDHNEHREHGLVFCQGESPTVNLSDKHQVAKGIDLKRDAESQDVVPRFGERAARAVRDED